MNSSLFGRLAALITILGMALAFAVATPTGAGAQINPCLGPTIPPVFIPAPTNEPTATERPIGIPPTAEPTDFPITDVRDFSQRVDDNKTSLPTSTPDCSPDPRETPVPTEESCDPGPELTPENTATTESTATTEPTVTPSPTATIEPTATDPVPGFTDDNTLAFAQIDCDDDGDGDGGDDGAGSDDGDGDGDGGDDGAGTDDGSDPTPPGYDLPKTGAGDDNGLASTLIIGVMAAATLLFAAGVTSSRKRNQ